MFELGRPVCGFCQQPANLSVLGPLLGPINGTEYYVHRPCAVWSPEVHESEEGTLHRVLEAVRRGRQLKCSHCGKRGASVGCRVHKCKETYHALCAHESGCSLYHTYCIACPAHEKRYKKYELHPQPFFLIPSAPTPAKDPATGNVAGDQHGSSPGAAGGGALADFFSPVNYKGDQNGLTTAQPAASRLGDEHGFAAAGGGAAAPSAGLDGQNKNKKTKKKEKRNHDQLEEAYARKAQAEQIMKRVRAHQRRGPIENVSDDEEHFAKRESARMQRDIAKLNPITLGAVVGAPSSTAAAAPRAAQNVYIKAPKGAPKTAAPQIELAANTSVVDAVTATDFDDLAGMDDVVRQLREMVLLPLQYPELFRHLGVAPPRGILFHGVPGTGKTLAARALAGACARHSPVPVTFFARKGADCLGKFVGEAERTLRLMFQEASARAPSIIFFDELDALVPSRGRGSGHQDQIHASVVSTLLTLMDGMADRGNVVVIASTNRPDDIDPALRRPGRFDREVYFELPQAAQREAILKAHTRRWDPVPGVDVIKKLASVTDGYAGADLAALCTAAVMNAVRRVAPQLLQHAEALADGGDSVKELGKESGAAPCIPESICVEKIDWDTALASAPPPCSKRHAAQALAADARRPMAYHTAPLLLPSLREVLEIVGKSALPLPSAVKQATEAARATAELSTAAFESALAALGAIQRAPDHLVDTSNSNSLPSTPPAADVTAAPLSTSGAAPAAAATNHQPSGLGHTRIGTSCPPLRLLISGTDDAGQDQIAGAVLRLFGGSHVSVISLPSIVAEGAGDAAQGVISLIQAALQRADRHSTLVLHLPHVEAWAVAPDVVVVEEEREEEEDDDDDDDDDGKKNNTAAPSAEKRPKRKNANNATPVNVGNAFSPTSPSFAGLSSRSLRMGRAAAAAATATNNHASADEQQHRSSLISDLKGDKDTFSSMPASDAWIACEFLIREAAPQQPLLILATTTAPRDLLPANLISVFESSGGIVSVESSSHLDTTTATTVEAVFQEVLVMKRVEEVAKSALASHAAAVFLDTIMESIHISSSKERKKIAKPVSENPGQPIHYPPSGNLDNAPAESSKFDDRFFLADLIAKKKASVNLNSSEWEKAQELFTSVQRFLVALGATLAKDRRCRAAGATFPPPKTKISSNTNKYTEEYVRLYTLVLAAAQGRYLSLEQFQGAVARAVGAISKAAEQEERTGQDFLHHTNAVALAHSIQDQIASSCHALRISLDLYDPVNARLLRAATGFAADVAMMYQQREEQAIAAAMAAEAAEEAAAAAEAEAQAAADAAEAAELEEQVEGEDNQVEVDAMDVESEEEENGKDSANQEQDVAAALPSPAASPVPAADAIENSTPVSQTKHKEPEEQEAPSSTPPLAAAVHVAAAQIQRDLLERVQLNTNNNSASLGIYGLIVEGLSNKGFSRAWRAVNEALPVLVAKGMAACEVAKATSLTSAATVGSEDELAGLRTAFVDTLSRHLNE